MYCENSTSWRGPVRAGTKKYRIKYRNNFQCEIITYNRNIITVGKFVTMRFSSARPSVYPRRLLYCWTRAKHSRRRDTPGHLLLLLSLLLFVRHYCPIIKEKISHGDDCVDGECDCGMSRIKKKKNKEKKRKLCVIYITLMNWQVFLRRRRFSADEYIRIIFLYNNMTRSPVTI